MSKEEELFDKTIMLIKNYLFDKSHKKIRSQNSFEELKENLGNITPEYPNQNEIILEAIKKYIQTSVKTKDERYMQSLWGGNHITAILGEVLVASTNTSMYTFDTAPSATVIEKSIISKLLQLIGWQEGDGVFTSGGSNGNLLGLLCARNYSYPEYSKIGNRNRRFQIFISKESHYSVENAARIIGIGTENIIEINCNHDGEMDPEDLEKKIQESIQSSFTPFCVVATAGTTVRGCFDPIDKIANICKKFDIWLHLDAAWGGAVLFSEKHRMLLEGIERTNSICFDPHKLMGVPLICSTFLVNNPQQLREISSCVKDPSYLFHGEDTKFDLGKISLACGRRADAIKLWLTWLSIGTKGWGERVDYCIELAKYLENLVVKHPQLELMSSRKFTNVCFRWRPKHMSNKEEINNLNFKLRQKLVAKGNFMISSAQLGDTQILRPVIAHTTIQKSTLNELIIEIEKIAKKL